MPTTADYLGTSSGIHRPQQIGKLTSRVKKSRNIITVHYFTTLRQLSSYLQQAPLSLLPYGYSDVHIDQY
jgi:hypothetical protein